LLSPELRQPASIRHGNVSSSRFPAILRSQPL
jgi:hypothetical protein